jgi:hypothetical protein
MRTSRNGRFSTALYAGIVTLWCLFAVSAEGFAQNRSPHVGFGLDLTMGPPDNPATGSAVGLGFRGRVSYPVSYDVSLAAGAGISGGFHKGWEDAPITLTPQASVIVTVPNEPWAPYFLAGFGGYVPLRSIARGGPSVHGGIGWARLLTDASIYVEVNPQLVISETASRIVLPLRAGVIF